MIYSMTGYAVTSTEVGHGTVQCELRSVNSRYLDLAFRIPEDLRFAEPIAREQIAACLSRGKVECRMNLQSSSESAASLQINFSLLNQLENAQAQIRKVLPESAPMSVTEILRWPNILAEKGVSAEALTTKVQALIKEALEQLCATRAREGEKLAQMLRDRVTLMREKVAIAEPLMPVAIELYRERLALRLREAAASLDEDRIRQEVSLFAQRVDVAEEFTRLTTHLDEVERVLNAGGAVGKRLDFLMQELNREANTLASKSVSAELTTIAVDLKLYIEQMREQVQNLE